MVEEPAFEKVASDERGASYRVVLPDNRELMLIFTKAGYMRGGHSHDRPETSMLLTGKVHYWKISKGVETEFDEKPGETLHNEPGEIHLAKFLEDSWLLDWKIDSHVGEWVTTNYPPYRDRIPKPVP